MLDCSDDDENKKDDESNEELDDLIDAVGVAILGASEDELDDVTDDESPLLFNFVFLICFLHLFFLNLNSGCFVIVVKLSLQSTSI